MAKALQRRRGTHEEHKSFTGLEGEFTYDTTEKRIVAHDGVTKGGIPMAKKSEVDAIDVGVTSINGQKGALSSAQLGCLPTGGGVVEGGVTVRADIHLEPPTSEGGQMVLMPALDDQTSSGIFIDTAWGQLRFFGHPSRDGVTRTGVGRVLCYDPYANALFIDGQHIVRSINGVNADVSGNVALELGGTVSLKQTISASATSSYGTSTVTVSGLTANKPVYVVGITKDTSENNYGVTFFISSGVIATQSNSSVPGSGNYAQGYQSARGISTNVTTGTSIAISYTASKGATFEVYQ